MKVAVLETFALIPLIAGILWLGLAPAPQLQRIQEQSQLIAAPTTTAEAPAPPAAALAAKAGPAALADALGGSR